MHNFVHIINNLNPLEFMRKVLMTLPLAGVMLLSCSKQPIESLIEDREDIVTFRHVSQMTKATESSFEEGDAVSVFASDDYYGELGSYNYSDNSEYIYSSGQFRPASSEDGITYPDEYTSLCFYAVWPYSSSYHGDEIDFEVHVDQSYPEDYAASDLMLAVTDATHSETVDLYFDHLMCKIVINIHGNEFPTGEWICMFDNVYTEAVVNLNDRSASAVGELGYVLGSLNGNNSFKVLLPPQTIKNGTEFFYFAIGEDTWLWTPEQSIILTSGVEYVYDLYI